jgi:serine/threonine protein kinase
VQGDIYVNQQIGNYRIEKRIASGSFGTVYLAQHLYLKQRTVVIKVLHAVHLGSEEEKEQFLQEAQILETLKGIPYILPLFDVGIHGDTPYMIAEYAEQGSLRARMRKISAPLPLEEVLTIISQVGQGLQGAHDRQIVHRDLKPENILFDAKSEALLADFGISTVLSTTSVKYTHVAGTPAYMAPEQFRGEVSKESDQYALACITYELLTGRKLFEAPDFVSMGFLHVSEAPTLPRQLNPQIPEVIEHALLKALSKQRTERYPSVSAFVTALNAKTAPTNPNPRGYTGDTHPMNIHHDQVLNERSIPIPPPPQYIAPSPVQTPVQQQQLYAPVDTPRPQIAASEQNANISTPQRQNQPNNFPYPAPLPPGGAMIEHGYNRYAAYDEAAIKSQTDAHLIRSWMRFASTLFYILPVISWIIYFTAGQKNIFLRFHYFQAVRGWILWLLIAIGSIVLYVNHSSALATSIQIFWWATLIWCVTAIITALAALGGKFFSLPFLGQLARRFAHRVDHGVTPGPFKK